MGGKADASRERILNFLRERSREGLPPPSVREICTATGLKSTSSVHSYLRSLEEEGIIKRNAGLNRSITLSDEQPVVQVPLLGRVTAGAPVYAFEDVVATIPYPADRNVGSELFALRVSGESMINAGILDGDVIIAEKTRAAYNGEIVVALIDDEATVKRIYREEGRIRLQPENDAYEPIYATQVTVLGKVVACIRYYGW